MTTATMTTTSELKTRRSEIEKQIDDARKAGLGRKSHAVKALLRDHQQICREIVYRLVIEF